MLMQYAGALAIGAAVVTAPSGAKPSLSEPATAPALLTDSKSVLPHVAEGTPLPSLTPVEIEILATINSAVNKIGEHFPIRLARPVALPDGREIPAGVTGQGDVVHAAKSRFGGKPGELILAARYLDWNGARIPLRSMRYLRATGKNNQEVAQSINLAGAVVPMVSIAAMFITGGEVVISQGTRAEAKTSAAVFLPPTKSENAVQPQQEGSLTQ